MKKTYLKLLSNDEDSRGRKRKQGFVYTVNYRQGFEVTTYFVSPKDTTQLPYSEPNDMSRRLLSL